MFVDTTSTVKCMRSVQVVCVVVSTVHGKISQYTLPKKNRRHKQGENDTPGMPVVLVP